MKEEGRVGRGLRRGGGGVDVLRTMRLAVGTYGRSNKPEPESIDRASISGACGLSPRRSGSRLLYAFGQASTDALPPVLVASCGSARPASRLAAPRRSIRTLG